MADGRSHPIDRLVRLVSDVFTLHQIILQSRFDATVQDEGVRLTYLIDPDLLELWALPTRWTAELAALASLHEEGFLEESWIDDDQTARGAGERFQPRSGSSSILEATALLTGENIFSQEFVGHKNSLYVSPEHMPEFVSHALRIERTFVRAIHQVGRSATDDMFNDLRYRLNVATRLHEERRTPPQEWLDATREILVDGLAGVSHSELLAHHRLERLQQRSLLANADSIDAFTPDILAPPFRLVTSFSERIRAEKRRYYPKAPPPEPIDRDAVTLTQLTMLNRSWRANRRAFVLITRDRSLYAAFHDWMDRQPYSGDSFFPLRHPRQYIPILNMRDMGGIYRDSTVFPALEESCRGVVSIFSPASVGENGGLGLRVPGSAWLRRELRSLNSELTGIAETLSSQIDEIGDTWSSLLKYAITAKSDVIEELVHTQTQWFKNLVTSRELERPFNSEVEKLRRRFERLTTSSTLLRHEIWVIQNAQARAGTPDEGLDDFGRRQIASRFKDFRSTSFRDKTLRDLMAVLRGPDGVNDLQSAEHRAERLFVSGTLALEVGAWSSASSLFGLAAEAFEQAERVLPIELREEIGFFASMSNRLSASSDNWELRYEAAQTQLEEQFDSERREFERVRALSESLALSLCSIAWNFEATLPHKNARANYDIDQAQSIIARLRRDFGQHVLPPSYAATNSFGPIQVQIALNITNLFFWAATLGRRNEAEIEPLAASALVWLRANERDREGPHGYTYPALANIWMVEPSQIRQTAQDLSEHITALLAKDDDKAFAYRLPPVDVVEFRKILLVLRQLAESGGLG